MNNKESETGCISALYEPMLRWQPLYIQGGGMDIQG